MSSNYYSDIFPEQMFPDVELGSVVLTKNTLTVSINDSTLAKTREPSSEWVLSKDDEHGLFYGEGDMIFSYKGAASLKWRNLHEKIWREGGLELLPRLAALDLVRRDPNLSILDIFHNKPDLSIDLQFSNRKKGFVLYIQLEKVTHFEWSGEEYDEYSDPERFR